MIPSPRFSLSSAIAGLILMLAAPLHASDAMRVGPQGFQPIRIVQTLEPRFPVILQATNIRQGEARVIFNIDAEGRLADLMVASYTHRAFADEAVQALRAWRYEPARQYGEPIGVRSEMVFTFEARGKVVTNMAIDTVSAFTSMLETENQSHTFRVVDPVEIDGPVLAIRSIRPAHPAHPQGANRTDLGNGRVVIDFYIDEEGRPRMPVVIHSDDSAFSTAAVSSLLQWRYSTPTRNGRPVSVRAHQRFEFTKGS